MALGLRTIVLHLSGPIEQISIHKNILGVQCRSDYPYPNFPPHFYVFINIQEYANEIIFIKDHWMKGLVKLYH